MALIPADPMIVRVPARSSEEPVVSSQLWMECHGCGWKQWLDLMIVAAHIHPDAWRAGDITIEAVYRRGTLPPDLFARHVCEPT